MARNIEVKARVRDPARFRELVESIADAAPVTIRQEDVFFGSPRGRLKLRKLGDGTAELIHYERSDSFEPSHSDYVRVEVSDALGLEEALSRALGVRGIVRKERRLYRVDRTRIHFDRVESLGNFMELEVVLEPDESAETGSKIAEELLTRLAIGEDELVDRAYIDLLDAGGSVG